MSAPTIADVPKLLEDMAAGYRAVHERHGGKPTCQTINGALEYGRAQGMEMAANYVATRLVEESNDIIFGEPRRPDHHVGGPTGPGETHYVSNEDGSISRIRWNDHSWTTRFVSTESAARPDCVARKLRDAYIEGWADRGISIRSALGLTA
jgi:hypothetical protein